MRPRLRCCLIVWLRDNGKLVDRGWTLVVGDNGLRLADVEVARGPLATASPASAEVLARPLATASPASAEVLVRGDAVVPERARRHNFFTIGLALVGLRSIA